MPGTACRFYNVPQDSTCIISKDGSLLCKKVPYIIQLDLLTRVDFNTNHLAAAPSAHPVAAIKTNEPLKPLQQPAGHVDDVRTLNHVSGFTFQVQADVFTLVVYIQPETKHSWNDKRRRTDQD